MPIPYASTHSSIIIACDVEANEHLPCSAIFELEIAAVAGGVNRRYETLLLNAAYREPGRDMAR